jgi:hypothetical protein
LEDKKRMLKLAIAGIHFELITGCLINSEQLEPFRLHEKTKKEIEIEVIPVDKITPPQNTVFGGNYYEWLHEDNNMVSLYVINQVNNEISGLVRSDSEWKKVTVRYLKNIVTAGDIITGRLGEIIFLNELLFHQGLLIHAAAIEWKEKGVIFTAPSGTGKSTQANLWKELMGAEILNGDRSAVRIMEGKPYVFGSPWCGSSNQYLNRRAILFAIIILEQSKENTLTRLENKEALPLLLPRCFLPYYDNGTIMNQALKNLEKIMVETPIYLLRCRPDREAVEMVNECIK